MAQRQRKRPNETETVRIAGALAIPSVLRSLGADPVRVLAEAGVDIALFDNPDNLISFAKRSRLIKHCVDRTGCAHFGLLVGAHNGLDSLGMVGLLMRYAPDVGTALANLVRHLHLHGRGGATTLTVTGAMAALGYGIHLPQTVASDQIGDGAVAFMFNLLRALCGPDWTPIEVLFAHRQPENVQPFRRLLRARLRFDAEQNALVFRAEQLERKLPAHDPQLYELLRRQVEALESQRSDDLPGQVRTALRTALTEGDASAQRIAATFSMHSRTLSRRLGAYGTSFQQLVDETRYEIARQMLEASTMDVRQIGLLLDYADASAFTRAFRRWSATTPGQWRARSRAGA